MKRLALLATLATVSLTGCNGMSYGDIPADDPMAQATQRKLEHCMDVMDDGKSVATVRYECHRPTTDFLKGD